MQDLLALEWRIWLSDLLLSNYFCTNSKTLVRSPILWFLALVCAGSLSSLFSPTVSALIGTSYTQNSSKHALHQVLFCMLTDLDQIAKNSFICEYY